MTDLMQARLKELLHYDPATGIFTWLRCGRGRPIGKRAGFIEHNGRGRRHRRIKLDFVSFTANRLAWLYMTGEWPAQYVDHINGDSLDDRWANFRLATSSQNGANARIYRNNSTGFKGVVYHKTKRRFAASIGVQRKLIHLGYFDTAEEASQAYAAAAKQHFGDFARAG